MSIDARSNVHAAATIYASPDMGPPGSNPVPVSDPPPVAELPAVNSLGCSVFDLRALIPSAIGVHLIKLHYPLASSQASVHVMPFAYVASDGSSVGSLPDLQFVVHIDDTFKLVISLAPAAEATIAVPFHILFISFDPTPIVERMITPPFPVPFLP
jgi:hypothetical protein